QEVHHANRTIPGLFTEQVEKTPNHIALKGYPGIKYKSHKTHKSYMTYISYRQLHEKSDRLAGLLIAKGVGPGTIVGMMMERSVEMIVGILGILKAGGAYLPIEPGYPQERIDYMLKDSGTEILLKDDDFTPGAFNNCPDGTSSPPHPLTHSPTQLCYIIYTSGTTGKPKGVIVEHKGAVNTLLYRKEEYRMNTDVVALQLFSYAFDGFVTSLFTPIVSGARIVLPNREDIANITKIKEIK
ncbi:MAG: amino acid adenylation domain-containing protein, partial [bacterium]|nr:amino acid adenylation domain-containing protein [bacterium]